MLKSKLTTAIQQEIRRHNWTEHAEDEITAVGCKTCRMQIATTNRLIEHIVRAALAPINRLSVEGSS